MTVTLANPGLGMTMHEVNSELGTPAAMWEWRSYKPSGSLVNTGSVNIVASANKPCCPPGNAVDPSKQDGACLPSASYLCEFGGSKLMTTSYGYVGTKPKAFSVRYLSLLDPRALSSTCKLAHGSPCMPPRARACTLAEMLG